MAKDNIVKLATAVGKMAVKNEMTVSEVVQSLEVILTSLLSIGGSHQEAISCFSMFTKRVKMMINASYKDKENGSSKL